jgi:hypothetical protein
MILIAAPVVIVLELVGRPGSLFFGKFFHASVAEMPGTIGILGKEASKEFRGSLSVQF